MSAATAKPSLVQVLNGGFQLASLSPLGDRRAWNRAGAMPQPHHLLHMLLHLENGEQTLTTVYAFGRLCLHSADSVCTQKMCINSGDGVCTQKTWYAQLTIQCFRSIRTADPVLQCCQENSSRLLSAAAQPCWTSCPVLECLKQHRIVTTKVTSRGTWQNVPSQILSDLGSLGR